MRAVKRLDDPPPTPPPNDGSDGNWLGFGNFGFVGRAIEQVFGCIYLLSDCVADPPSHFSHDHTPVPWPPPPVSASSKTRVLQAEGGVVAGRRGHAGERLQVRDVHSKRHA